MGAIQNSLNSITTSVAAGVLAAKGIGQGEDESAKALKEADTLLKKSEAEEALGKLKDQYDIDSKELKQWKQGKVDVGNGNYMETNEDLSKDIKMRKKSLKIMKEKIKARKLQLDTYSSMLGGKK